MEMLTKKINAEVNQFPRLTWHHLHINHGELDVTLNKLCPSVIDISEAKVEFVEKYRTEAYGAEHKLTSQLGHQADQALDSFVDEAKLVTDVFTVKKSEEKSIVKIKLVPAKGEGNFHDYVIHAESGSKSTFIFSASSEKEDDGVLGIRIRVFADENSSVQIVTANLLGKDYTYFGAISTLVMEKALVRFTDLQLGGKKSITGVRHTLAEYKASNSGEQAYLARDNQELDINYVTHQIGRETESSFLTEGVVAGNAKKTWRGTIDFVRGCTDSKGNENENVLLLNPDVINKSLPVILCDEEAVEGSHGTSIGKLGKDMLFYLQSRGVSEEEARLLMVRAKVNSVCRAIPDEELVKKIESFVEGAFA